MTSDHADARIAALETALRSLGMAARLLFSNSAACVVLHHAGDANDLPGWLTDCRAEIDKAHAVLMSREARP